MSTTYHLSLAGYPVTVTAKGEYYQAKLPDLNLSVVGENFDSAVFALKGLVASNQQPLPTISI